MFVTLALAALLIEAAISYPQSLFALIGHPVTWIGQLIAWLDRPLNQDADTFATRRHRGVVCHRCHNFSIDATLPDFFRE